MEPPNADWNMKTPHAVWVNKIESIDTGVGCIVDFIYIKDGRVIRITNKSVSIYENRDALNNDKPYATWLPVA